MGARALVHAMRLRLGTDCFIHTGTIYRPAAPPAPLTPSEPTDLDLWREGDPVARALYGSQGPPGAWDESEQWADQLADQIANYDGYDGCSYSRIGPW